MLIDVRSTLNGLTGRLSRRAELRELAAAVALLGTLLTIQPARADDVYRYLTPQGRVEYSDRRPVGRTDVLPMADTRPGPLYSAWALRDLRRLERQAIAADARFGAPSRAAATTALGAESRATAGLDPLPGERTGLRNGRSRLQDTYFRRTGIDPASTQSDR
jgi:hypothetical protein